MNSATNSTEDTSEKGCLTGLLLLLQNATGNLRGNQKLFILELEDFALMESSFNSSESGIESKEI